MLARAARARGLAPSWSTRRRSPRLWTRREQKASRSGTTPHAPPHLGLDAAAAVLPAAPLSACRNRRKDIVRANVVAFGAPLWPLYQYAMMGLWRSGGVDEPPGPGGAGPLCRCRRSWRLW